MAVLLKVDLLSAPEFQTEKIPEAGAVAKLHACVDCIAAYIDEM